MTGKPAPRFWYRCRSCGHSRASDWLALPADLTGAACNSCGCEEITLYELATRAAVRLPRPLIPPVQRYTCCHCGGTGLDSLANTCPACLGAGFC
ncbi:hypothetical protein GCM10009678_63060 [Actinomadura kijaniata]|uniref:DNA-directed RNA polymerase subunit RPC12/RpoP n=1 Tax=Actinomadura namibiensis TaxID=182080 RepID=A0A7W3LWM2_ACTNM|nr:hypothetical protein [Actinomadura namibiensis]MBA8955681.1 DNA-directed RNA polymerase subunit RPC12/RpoP [Actinomadura namibiensis]